MRPVSHTVIDTIRSPIESVFAHLTDPGSIPAWLPGCTSVHCEGALRKGARMHVQFGMRRTEFEIVDFAPLQTLGWVERGQRRGWKTFFRLDPAGDSTAVTVRAVWTPHSVGAWFRGRFLERRSIRGQLNAILLNLRTALTG